MPLTGSMLPSAASVQPNQVIQVSLTLANGGATAVLVSGCQPYLTPYNATNGSVAGYCGTPNLTPGFPTSVAAGGTLTLTFPACIYGFQRWDSGLGNGQIMGAPPEPAFVSVQCTVTASDGTTLYVPPATLQVGDNFPLAPGTRGGNAVFSLPQNAQLLM